MVSDDVPDYLVIATSEDDPMTQPDTGGTYDPLLDMQAGRKRSGLYVDLNNPQVPDLGKQWGDLLQQIRYPDKSSYIRWLIWLAVRYRLDPRDERTKRAIEALETALEGGGKKP
ncbi:MAG: hypothetical protein ACE15D_18625 [Candidatus Eisenbacteria bacterium]